MTRPPIGPECTPTTDNQSEYILKGMGLTSTPLQTRAVPPPTPSVQDIHTSHKNPGKTPANTPTVTNTNTAVAASARGQVVRGDVENNKALPIHSFGPYPQTLFLGCSIVNFNVSLSYGSQPSSLTVNLLEDRSPHYALSYEAKVNRPNSTMTYYQAASAVWGIDNHYYNVMQPQPGESASVYKGRVQNFIDENGNVTIPGKVFYYNNGSSVVQRYWTGPDPGFFGDRNRFQFQGQWQTGKDPFVGMNNNDPDVFMGTPMDIVGCPVYFRFDDFEFAGIIKNWKLTSGNDQARQYTVSIESPNSIVDNAQLILDKYNGSIFNKVGALMPDGYQQISGPHNNINMPARIPLNSYKGKFREGNIPNVINVYGYIESLAPGGYGAAEVTENGIRSAKVVTAINWLLGRPGGTSRGTGYDSDNMFNPYGALVGRTPQSVHNAEQIRPYAIYSLTSAPTVQDMTYAMPAFAGGGISRTGACSPDPSKPNQGTCTNYGLYDDIVEYNEEIEKDLSKAGDYTTDSALSSRGVPCSIWDFGLIPPEVASDGEYRQLYYLDLSELPEIPPQLRTATQGDPIKGLGAFVSDICKNAGYDFFWEMIYIKVGSNMRNIIKLRTISRKIQPSTTMVKDFIQRLHRQGVSTAGLSIGVEGSDAKSRVLMFGDHQKRLYQAKNMMIPYRTDNYLYNPAIGSFVHYEYDYVPSEERNKYRVPASWSQREPAGIHASNDAATASYSLKNTRVNELIKTDFGMYDGKYMSYGGSTAKGNYDDTNVFTYFNKLLGNMWGATGQASFSSYINNGTFSLLREFLYGIYPCKPTTSAVPAGKQELINIKYYNPNTPCPQINTPTTNTRGTNVWDIFSNTALSIASFLSLLSRNWFKGNTLEAATFFADKLSKVNNSGAAAFGANGAEVNVGNLINARVNGKRFHPLMNNAICPFYGYSEFFNAIPAYDMKSTIRRPRPVWFDTWLNIHVVVFNVKELPITSLSIGDCLKGTYAGNSFIVTESELRAALEGFDSWLAYCSGKLFKPDIVIMLHNCLCGDRTIPLPEDPPDFQQAQQANTRTRPQADNPIDIDDTNGTAGSSTPPSLDSGTYNPNYELLNDNDFDGCKIFASIFRVETSWGNAKTGQQPTAADAPVNKNSGLAARVYADIEILFKFFQNIAQQHYGKDYMIRMPMTKVYKDTDYSNNKDNKGYFNLGGGFVLSEGGGKYYSNYSISPEGAWEEWGNTIDDTIMIGSTKSFGFREDDNKIGPILGYMADDHFDWEAYAVCLDIKDNIDFYRAHGNQFYFYDLLKKSGRFSRPAGKHFADWQGADC